MEYSDWIARKEAFFLSLYVIVLFFVMVPGILLNFPRGASFHIKALVHAVLFALLWHFTSHYAYSLAFVI